MSYRDTLELAYLIGALAGVFVTLGAILFAFLIVSACHWLTTLVTKCINAKKQSRGEKHEER